MSEIALRFVREAGIASNAISWFGGDLGFSHVGAIVRGDVRPAWWPSAHRYCGRPGYELGARSSPDQSLTGKPGVQLRPLDYARFVREETIRVPASDQQAVAFWNALSRQLGCPYSSRTIWGFVLGREIMDRGRWDCSTLVSWSLVEAGLLPETLRPHLQQISPNTLWAMTTALAWARA